MQELVAEKPWITKEGNKMESFLWKRASFALISNYLHLFSLEDDLINGYRNFVLTPIRLFVVCSRKNEPTNLCVFWNVGKPRDTSERTICSSVKSYMMQILFTNDFELDIGTKNLRLEIMWRNFSDDMPTCLSSFSFISPVGAEFESVR